MLDQRTIFNSNLNFPSPTIDVANIQPMWDSLQTHGYCLLRNYSTDLPKFSKLVKRMCKTVTLDPARSNSANAIQKVDAGTDALGLHIENGNTPNAPQLVFFYCQQAPRKGSQTTLCDGVKLLNDLPDEIRSKFEQEIYVSRTISEQHWKTYIANEHPLITSDEQATHNHLIELLASQDNIEGVINEDGSLSYRLTINPILSTNLCNLNAFANAVMGPSFSYEIPIYEFSDGSPLSKKLLSTLKEIAERHTIEIPWKDGDIAIIDNHRVMHGRREILDSSCRKLFIGMGSL